MELAFGNFLAFFDEISNYLKQMHNKRFLFYRILMKGITWSRDSHGLFDYESRHLTKKTLKAERPVIITRNNNELSLSHYNEEESF